VGSEKWEVRSGKDTLQTSDFPLPHFILQTSDFKLSLVGHIGHGAPDIMAGSTDDGGSGTREPDRRAELWRAVEREGRGREKCEGEEIRRVVIAAQTERD
jgi:hypothetical protein